MNVSGPEPARWRAAPEDVLGVALLVAILVAMALGVFYRYVLNDSLTWPEEAARYGLAYVAFLGLITGVRRNTHIRIDAVDQVLPPAVGRTIELLVRVACLIFFVYMAYLSWRLCLMLHRTSSAAMRVPMSFAYGALVVGFVGAALRLGWMLAADLRRLARGRPGP